MAVPKRKIQTIRERNERYTRRVLLLCGGSVTDAAEALGIGRATLYRWVAKLGLPSSGQR